MLKKKISSKIDQLQRKLRYSCYTNKEYAKDGKCPEIAGATKVTEYLSEKCIGYPYLCLDWKDDKNE